MIPARADNFTIFFKTSKAVTAPNRNFLLRNVAFKIKKLMSLWLILKVPTMMWVTGFLSVQFLDVFVNEMDVWGWIIQK